MANNTNVKNLNLKSLKSFFYMWLMFLKPYHKLRNKEMEVLSLFLLERYKLSKVITDEAILDKMLFNKEIKDNIKKEMGYETSQVLSNMLNSLRNKGALEGNSIRKGLIPNLEMGSTNFQLIFNFNFNET